MIQRKQTLYLVVVLLLALANLSSSLLTISSQGGESFQILGTDFICISVLDYATHPIPILLGVIALLVLFVIFLYQQRKLQILLSKLVLVSLVLYVGYLAYTYYKYAQQAYSVELNMISVTNLLSILIMFIVIRLIRKDIALLNSLNRLR